MNEEFAAYVESRGLRYTTSFAIDADIFVTHFIYRFNGERYASIEISQTIIDMPEAWPTLLDMAVAGIDRELRRPTPEANLHAS